MRKARRPRKHPPVSDASDLQAGARPPDDVHGGRRAAPGPAPRSRERPVTEPAPRNDDTKKPEPTQDGDERPPDPRIGTPDDVSKTAPNEGDASADGRPIEKGEVTEREFSDYSEVKNPRQRAFLVGFRQSCNVRTACEVNRPARAFRTAQMRLGAEFQKRKNRLR